MKFLFLCLFFFLTIQLVFAAQWVLVDTIDLSVFGNHTWRGLSTNSSFGNDGYLYVNNIDAGDVSVLKLDGTNVSTISLEQDSGNFYDVWVPKVKNSNFTVLDRGVGKLRVYNYSGVNLRNITIDESACDAYESFWINHTDTNFDGFYLNNAVTSRVCRHNKLGVEILDTDFPFSSSGVMYMVLNSSDSSSYGSMVTDSGTNELYFMSGGGYSLDLTLGLASFGISSPRGLATRSNNSYFNDTWILSSGDGKIYHLADIVDTSKGGGASGAAGSGGGDLGQTLSSWNPDVYPLLVAKVKDLFAGGDLNNFFNDLFDVIVLFVEYILRSPTGSFVPVEGG